MDIPERVTPRTLPAARWPSASSWSITPEARTTTSVISPARTSLAASTPPIERMSTLSPELCSYCAESSPRMTRVAIDETAVMVVLMAAD